MTDEEVVQADSGDALPGRAADRYQSPIALLVPATVLGIALLRLLAHWYRRDYTHDDFYLAFLAWVRSTPAVAGRDFWVPNFTPLAEVASPIFAAFPESFLPLDILRTAVLFSAFAILVLTTLITYRLTESTPWALTAAAVVVTQEDFFARIGDIRSDPFATCLLLFVIYLLLRDQAENARLPVLLMGVLAGSAATLSSKFVVALPFVFAALALAAGWKHFIPSLLRFSAGVSITPSLYFIWRVLDDGWLLVRSVLHEILASAGSGIPLGNAIRDAIIRAPLMVLILAMGALGFCVITPADRRKIPAIYTLLTLAFLLLFRQLNPFMYPYALTLVVPLVAPFVGGVARFYGGVRRPLIEVAVITLVSLVGLRAGLHAFHRADSRTNVQQRAFVEWLWKTTMPGEQIFDWQGLHFGRPGIPHWWTYGGVTHRYKQGGWYTLEEEFRAGKVTLLIQNYRLGWFTNADRDFLAAHYLATSPCTVSPGFLIPANADRHRIEVLVEGRYTIAPPQQPLNIEGIAHSGSVVLTRGWHSVSVIGAALSKRIAMVYVTPLRRVPPPCDHDTVLLYGF